MSDHRSRGWFLCLLGHAIFYFSLICPGVFAQADLTARYTDQDLSSPGAAGWSSIPGVDFQTNGNPSAGGHGALQGELPMVNIKVAHDSTRIFMRFEWDDATQTDRDRILTFDGSSWNTSGNEDRLYVSWPIVDGPGRAGQTFTDIGCAVMCHLPDPINGDTLVPDTTSPLTDCSVCHPNSSGTKDENFVHLAFAVEPLDCTGCHLDREPLGGDMIAAADSAFDFWHWKAQRSAPLGLAEDQISADTVRRKRDGINLAPDNRVDDPKVAQYVFVSGTTAISDTTDLLLRSQIPAMLANDTLAEWNIANGRYELSDGTEVTVPNGTEVTRHILEDQSLTDPSANVLAKSSYSGGKWTVALSRDLVVPGESSDFFQALGALTDTDYAFDLNALNYFGFAVTDDSGHNHKGVGLLSLDFEPRPTDVRNWELYH